MIYCPPTFSGLECSTHCAVKTVLCSFFYIFLWVKILTRGVKPSGDRRRKENLRLVPIIRELVESCPPEQTVQLKTLHTCHTGDTAQWRCLRCSPTDRLGMLWGWHREHTECNYSATHTLVLEWWHHTEYRPHTCMTNRDRCHSPPNVSKKDKAAFVLVTSLHLLHYLYSDLRI